MSGLTLTDFYRFLSLNVWGSIHSVLQKGISKWYAKIYHQPWTRHLIPYYCKLHYQDSDYLNLFRPAHGAPEYNSFQDFFIRKYRQLPRSASPYVWPCEGLICDYGQIKKMDLINVKGDWKEVRVIFGQKADEIPDNHYFVNVFLHNNNYHRIHASVDAEITNIEYLPGELVLLRPWVYKKDPSLPALRNERVNIMLMDKMGRNWYLSIVGGPAVGYIKLPPEIIVGKKVKAIDELAVFYLGSTCCMAAPEPMHAQKGDTVYMGDSY